MAFTEASFLHSQKELGSGTQTSPNPENWVTPYLFPAIPKGIYHCAALFSGGVTALVYHCRVGK